MNTCRVRAMASVVSIALGMLVCAVRFAHGQGYPAGPAPQMPQAPAPPAYGAPPTGQAAPGAALDELMAWERQDLGVAPSKSLHDGPMHGATPNQIPGGQVITTKGLVALMQNHQARPLIFDVLGSAQQLPQAISAVRASQPGSFNDPTQQEFAGFLQQMTQGNRQVPLVFYCQGPQCWMSYNAALRAINLGYKNVLWYRGGIEAWQRAGLPLSGAQGGHAATPGGGYPPPGQPPSGYPPQGGYPQPAGGYPPPNYPSPR